MSSESAGKAGVGETTSGLEVYTHKGRKSGQIVSCWKQFQWAKGGKEVGEKFSISTKLVVTTEVQSHK